LTRLSRVSPEVTASPAPGVQASVIISHALGHRQVLDSTLANAVEAYCVPWRCVQIVIEVASRGCRPS
jgi:hypothetical protein